MPNDPILQLAAAATVEVLNSSINLNSTSLFSKADYATGSDPVSLNAEDLDGDGKRDMVVANTGSGFLVNPTQHQCRWYCKLCIQG